MKDINKKIWRDCFPVDRNNPLPRRIAEKLLRLLVASVREAVRLVKWRAVLLLKPVAAVVES